MGHLCTCHRRGRTDEEALGFELDVARSALREGDLAHAKHHVAGALGLAPGEARVHGLIDDLAARMDLTAVPEGGWYGEFALAAFALHKANEVDKAIDILADVTAVAPHVGFEHALTTWCAGQPALSSSAALKVARLLVEVNATTIGLNHLLEGERHLLGSFAGVAGACAGLTASGEQLGGAAGVLRRLGRSADSLDLARKIPGVPGRVTEGLAHRSAGDGLAAHAAFEAAERLDPKANYSVERARSLFVAGEAARAAALLPVDSAEPEIVGLHARCEQPGPTADARLAALDALRRSTAPAIDFPRDATARLFSQLEPGMQLMGVTSVSGWESPTNRLLAALLAGHSDVARASYARTFTDFERPVMAQRRGRLAAWVERSGVPVQAFPEPTTELRAALAEASDLTVASQLAEASAFATVSVEHLIAAMVHPPVLLAAEPSALPESVFDYQVACALALSAHGPGAGLEALESLVFGPVDWVSAAAVVALGEWTHRRAGVAHKGRALLLAAIDDLLPHSAEPRFVPLLAALKFLPGVPKSAGKALHDWYSANLRSLQA
jgi:hypothetical protein